MSDNIKVVVKVRPLISREIEEKLFHQWRVKDNTIYQIDQSGRDTGNLFTFDKIYDENTNTSDVYNDIAKPIVEAATAGFNGTIFAYGQTSSGKTYTMTGTETSPGLIPLSVINLFDIIKNITDRHFLIRVSYVEIYNETIIDLLNKEKKNIKIQDTFQGVKVDATVRVTTTPEEVFQFMKELFINHIKKCLVDSVARTGDVKKMSRHHLQNNIEGQANRQTAATDMNAESSRSHSIFQITIESREHTEGEEVGCLNMSQLNLVDLAGSERSGQTGATGLHFKEGTHINKSLSSLALVIKQLSERLSKHVNYRDSKLTRILQNSLGGNAKTSIICAVTPAAVEETISTLQFAYRAKAIKNNPEVNVIATDTTVIDNLTKQLSSLKTQLESKRNVEEDNQKLQKQIAVMQRFLSGFVQHGADMPRHGQPPRRATISAPPTRDDLTFKPPAIPKLYTPSLKYNSLALGRSMETMSKQSTGLASVPEEPARNTTPSPNNKITLTDEVIEIDSDDDAPPDMQTCSPYHKCFKSTKTPPCILRKNAEEAERNLRDIVELTEREKIYKPDVVELLEKLDNNTTVITKLEEEIEMLNNINKENESKLESLNEKIIENEAEVRSLTADKLHLEEQCKEFVTKLTDWEVTYETLKKKSKTREDELLSRLEEYSNVTKAVNTCNKSPEIAMLKDMSRGTSIVDSDYSIGSENTKYDSTSENLQKLVTDLQEQLIVRDKNISELEASVLTQTQKVTSLESKIEELERSIDSSEQLLANSENENCLHKTTIETLNSIIENQKCNLETATKDLQSYNDTIRELRKKISTKQNLEFTLDDDAIRDLIAVEEKSIANNENIANIIKALQSALDTKNNEVKCLKAAIEENGGNAENKLEFDTHRITELQENVTVLTQQLQQIQNEKEGMLQEKINLLCTLEELNSELAKSAESKVELEKNINRYETEIKDVNESNRDLLNRLNEKTCAVTELTANKTVLINQVKDNCDKINLLENNLQLKDAEIESLLKNNNEQVNKLQALILEFNDDTKADSSSSDVFEILNEKLTHLRNTTSAIVKERDEIKMQYSGLSNTILKSGKQFYAAIKSALDDIEIIQSTLRKSLTQDSEISANVRKRDFSLDNGSNITDEEDVEQDCLSQVTSLLKEISSLMSYMKQNIEHVKLETNSSISKLTNLLETRDLKIAELDDNINDMKEELDKKSQQLIFTVEQFNTAKKGDEEVFNDIVNAFLMMVQKLNIECDIPCEDKSDKRSYLNEHIVPILDKVVSRYIKEVEKDENIIKTKKEIDRLIEENTELNTNISQIERSRDEVRRELEEERQSNKSLIDNLKSTSSLLNDLKKELKMKVDEIDSMKNKILEWKEKFTNLEVMKKQQNEMYEKKIIKLKEKCREYELLQNKFESGFDAFLTEVKEKYVQESMQISQDSGYKSPLSLLTLSCYKVIQTIQDRADSSLTTTVSSKTSLGEKTSDSSLTCYQCNKLQTELRDTQNNNDVLINLIEESKSINENLMKEIKDASEELKSLMDYTSDLQKRILSHKTNLSTLTATTYAENKSLSSQVKFLQHHHTRFHTVCQRDLPELKEQLNELMNLLGEESLDGKLNTGFKRYSLPIPLENNSTLYSFKNESTLDGDLLMLDTNFTLVNSADNTLTGHDQTCLELADGCYNDTARQTAACCVHESNELCNKNIEMIQLLKIENEKLNDIVEKLKKTNVIKIDVETSTVKDFSFENKTETNICQDCKYHKEKCEQLIQEIDKSNLKITFLSSQKDDVEKKYNLEIQSTETLMRKLNNFEKELDNKNKSIEKLSTTLKATKNKLDSVQEENENLSTEIIESLSAVDNLKMELDALKNNSNKDLKVDVTPRENTESAKKLDKECPECLNKQEIIKILQSKNSSSHTRLNRSYSDSESSSRHNKICTLQNELDAGREDCNVLKEEVTTIKNQLESSNLSLAEAMDLDESISELNVVEVNKSCMPEISEENAADIYSLDRLDCYNYYIELFGDDKTNLNRDVKIIDIMKMFYTKLMTRHEDHIDNLVNKLRDYEDSKRELQERVSCLTAALEDSNDSTQKIERTFSELRNNISNLSNVIASTKENDTNEIELFKTNILTILDSEFSMNSLNIFECIYHKNLSSLNASLAECARLEEHLQKIDIELKITKDDLIQLKEQRNIKEKECNLLLAEKEKINNVCNALNLELRKQEQDFITAISEGYRKLVEESIIDVNDIDTTLPLIKNVSILFEKLVTQNKAKTSSDNVNQIENLNQEVKNYKCTIEQKDKELQSQAEKFETMKQLNENIKEKLKENEEEIQKQKSLFDDLNASYKKTIQEYNVQVTIVQKLTEEVGVLKEYVSNKDTIIQNMQKNINKIETEYNNLIKINHMLTNEKESMAVKLGTAEMEIERNKIDYAKMESDIFTLKTSLTENVSVVDGLKNEAKLLLEQNLRLKQELEQKSKDFARLEFNIKTHETTAKIQTNMISRLQKQKEEDVKIIAEKDKQIRELNHKFSVLQNECVSMRDCIESLRHEKDALTQLKLTLEDKISQLKKELEGGQKPRLSIETMVETTRRRRQSVLDSNRMFGDKPHDQVKTESTEERSKPDDMYMDVDESSSNRSTPVRRCKGRDSLQREESEEEGRSSRGGSVRAARQRRQSSHDLHRLALRTTPEGQESSRHRSRNETKHDVSNDGNTRVKELEERLSACQQELEELKERYRELDEECETCAEYLRERDDQCRKLKKEKASLENIIGELNEKLQRGHETSGGKGKNYAHAAVNTDEDWANLHSVVVDRMSFDAEVEKNKRLTKVIEELRMNKQELKTVVAKMQRALEEKTGSGRELERTRQDLRSCKEELEELRRRNVELDDECETCAQYLKEKEEQCRSLKESVAALEAKLEEQQAGVRGAAQSARRRRQSQHDHNREPAPPARHVATQITDDFLSNQVERDRELPVPDDTHTKQIKRLKVSIEKLTKEKAALEHQLASVATAPVYVATGSAIVQDQQLTDVMKENQKLKKINSGLIALCKKREKKTIVKSNRENQDPEEI